MVAAIIPGAFVLLINAVAMFVRGVLVQGDNGLAETSASELLPQWARGL